MRILITGTSPMQCGKNNRYRYGSVLDLYARALREAGHVIDHREWTPGDDLTSYDVALVGLVPFNSIAARHVYTVCDVIYRAKQSGVALVFAVDDWGFQKIRGAAVSLGKDVAKRLFTTIKGRSHREWGETAGLPMIEACVHAIATRPWPTTLVPAFAWGDHDRFEELPAARCVYLDPTPIQLDDYVTIPSAPRGEPRKREWMMGTLSDQREWRDGLELTWPVTYVGSKPSRAEAAIKEPELVQRLGQMWGSLCPPQPHAGAGWWRCRYVYTATAGAVLLADPREVAGLGGPYLLEPAEVEAMGDRDLATIAYSQREELLTSSPSREEFTTTLVETLKAELLGPVKQPSSTPVPTPAPSRSVVRRQAIQREAVGVERASPRERLVTADDHIRDALRHLAGEYAGDDVNVLNVIEAFTTVESQEAG